MSVLQQRWRLAFCLIALNVSTLEVMLIVYSHQQFLASLSCQVYWFKDGKQISKRNEHCKMRREGDGTCSLHIESTHGDDDGNYTIMAANPQVSCRAPGHHQMC